MFKYLQKRMAPKGKNADVKAAVPFLWAMGLSALVFYHVGLLWRIVFEDGLRDFAMVFFGLAIVCVLALLCALFWMSAQPNRGIAVLSPLTILKDKFTSRRPNG